MATCTETGLSVSYAYKIGCRCSACLENKARYTAKEQPKAKERARKWWAAHGKDKAREIKKRYVDKSKLNKYQELLRQYGDICQICGLSSTEGIGHGNKLHLDHDHETGKFRGMLCGSCNVGLGHFRDNPKLLNNAISYLTKHGKQ